MKLEQSSETSRKSAPDKAVCSFSQENGGVLESSARNDDKILDVVVSS
jgi:hypothetical protein